MDESSLPNTRVLGLQEPSSIMTDPYAPVAKKLVVEKKKSWFSRFNPFS
jgi:hypothetical protein